MTTFQTSFAPVSGGLRWVLAARRGLAGRWTRSGTVDDLSQLSDRALADIGLSRDDLPGASARAMRDHATRLSLAL